MVLSQQEMQTLAVSLPLGAGPWGVSIGLSPPGPSFWLCEYRMHGDWQG